MFAESLENRRLFAVLVGTELRVFGTAGNDNLQVSLQDPATIRVQENGAVSFFANAAVASFRMNVTPALLVTGTPGNDSVQIISTPALPITKPGILFGGAGVDTLTGGGGNDTLLGEADNDTLNGNAGNDTMNGGDGNNILNGGDGNDSMTAGLGADRFDGGPGLADSVSYATRVAPLTIVQDGLPNDGQIVIIPSIPPIIHPEGDNVLDTVENIQGGSNNDLIMAGPGIVNNVFSGNGGNDWLDGRSGNDSLIGGTGDDRLLGRDGNDVLQGLDGNDQLFGGPNNDNLFGGNGNDILAAGGGVNALRGEAGDDVLLAHNGVADAVLDGGAGLDIAEVDAGDPATIAVEILV
jgi:Ca2+-binding RTX toxin-like protein